MFPNSPSKAYRAVSGTWWGSAVWTVTFEVNCHYHCRCPAEHRTPSTQTHLENEKNTIKHTFVVLVVYRWTSCCGRCVCFCFSAHRSVTWSLIRKLLDSASKQLSGFGLITVACRYHILQHPGSFGKLGMSIWPAMSLLTYNKEFLIAVMYRISFFFFILRQSL